MNAAEFIRPEIATMEPYTPVVPFDVLVTQLGRTVDRIIKLNANENPYGSPPAVRTALAELRFAHIYPDPESRALRSALARFTAAPEELLLAGAGADELIDLIMRLFLRPGDAVLNCPPTFGMYAFDAAIVGAEVIAVRRRPDFGLDLAAMEAAVQEHRPKLLFVASPNNPDGNWLLDADLERLLGLPLVVVLDEAYVEFAGLERSRISWVQRCDNLIVLRTFSKWAGLAGLRVGYGAFPRSIMADLWKIKQPYGVSQAASAAAIAALHELDWCQEKAALLVAERERLTRMLEQTGYLQPYPSQANFVLCRVIGRDAWELKESLEHEGILVRHYRSPGLQDHVRVSVGRPDQTDQLLSVLRRL